MSDKPKHPGGRPTDYNPEIASRICELVSIHPYGLKKLTRLYPELPHETTINLWRHLHDEFSMWYNKAKLKQADLLAEECLDISDDSIEDYLENEDGNIRCNTEFVNRSRLRIDTRKWLAGKLLPKIYGDAKQVEELHADKERLLSELQALRAQLDAKNKKDY